MWLIIYIEIAKNYNGFQSCNCWFNLNLNELVFWLPLLYNIGTGVTLHFNNSNNLCFKTFFKVLIPKQRNSLRLISSVSQFCHHCHQGMGGGSLSSLCRGNWHDSSVSSYWWLTWQDGEMPDTSHMALWYYCSRQMNLYMKRFTLRVYKLLKWLDWMKNITSF